MLLNTPGPILLKTDIAGERQQVLRRTTLAAHPGKTVGQHPAGQELAKLPRDELGQAGPVCPVGGGAQEVSST